MKDYYRILQVHPEAEFEVIEAAYRRLMRKYHPDVLPAERRHEVEAIQKAKELNEAYEILGDPVRRAAYDRGENGRSAPPTPAYEKSTLFVRCGQTKAIFKAQLVRQQDSNSPFTLLGFAPAPDHLAAAELSTIERLTRRFKKREGEENGRFATAIYVPDLEQAQPNDLTMGDINWGAHTCPACTGKIENDNGSSATWIGCSKCGHIRCAGGVTVSKRGKISTCPWCGKRNKLNRSVTTGQKDHLQLHGFKKDGANRHKLPSGGKK